jgi:hypothetical protein
MATVDEKQIELTEGKAAADTDTSAALSDDAHDEDWFKGWADRPESCCEYITISRVGIMIYNWHSTAAAPGHNGKMKQSDLLPLQPYLRGRGLMSRAMATFTSLGDVTAEGTKESKVNIAKAVMWPIVGREVMIVLLLTLLLALLLVLLLVLLAVALADALSRHRC